MWWASEKEYNKIKTAKRVLKGCNVTTNNEAVPNISMGTLYIKVTVDLQRPNFANFFFFVPDIAKISI